MTVGNISLCGLTVIPVRAHHDDTSEIVTQLFFGEFVKIIQTHKQWIKIENLHDNYQGWVNQKQLLPIRTKHINLNSYQNGYQADEELIISTPWGNQKVIQGSPILSLEKSFTLDYYNFTWMDAIPTKSKGGIAQIALSYLNAPYLWGGRSKYGIDCSGFTQTVFHQAGHFIHRDASQQVLQGKEVTFEMQKEGDLAFFESETSGKITHVGIVLSNQRIIHAHGRVRIDRLDEKGIYNEQEKYYSHKLYNLKRHIN